MPNKNKLHTNLFFFFLLLSFQKLSSSSIPSLLGYQTYYLGIDDESSHYYEGSNYLINGISYNSFLIKDNKTVIIDTVPDNYKEKWLEKIEDFLKPRIAPDYFIIQHIDSQNFLSIFALIKKYPLIRIFSNEKYFSLIKKYFNINFNEHNIQVIKKNFELNLGGVHVLSFIDIPMFNWAETFVTFDKYSKILFSNLLFSEFGSIKNNPYSLWTDEARRFFYLNYNKNNKNFLYQLEKNNENFKTMATNRVYPAHGELTQYNTKFLFEKYSRWMKNIPDLDGVVIVYATLSKNTETAVYNLVEKLKYFGERNVVVHNLGNYNDLDNKNGHWSLALSDCFKYKKLVLASVTYNDDILPIMREFIETLVSKNFSKRVVSFMENGLWNPVAIKVMKQLMEPCEMIKYTKFSVTIRGKFKILDWFQIDDLATEIVHTEPIK